MSEATAELIEAVVKLVQAYRAYQRERDAKMLVPYVGHVVDVWEKHPRQELREIMSRDRAN